MKPTKKELLRLRHKENLTLDEIGEMFGISGERVRQIIGNTGSVRNAKQTIRCKTCGKKVKTYNSQYCSIKCFAIGKRLYADKALIDMTRDEMRKYWKRKSNKVKVN